MRRFLDMLFGAALPGELVELRWKPAGDPMRSEFLPAIDFHSIEDDIRDFAKVGDCYVGVCPRRRTEPQTGGRDAVDWAHVLWVDCDTPESVQALRGFGPRPSCVVRSGSGGVHAYWSIWPPLTADHVEVANRRLAHRLGADAKATDAPRILRPPGTLNWKHDPPKPVEVAHLEATVFAAKDVVGGLADPPRRNAGQVTAMPPMNALERIPAVEYFEVLTGMTPDREGKVTCPIPDHPDRTPSCHVYDRDWTCFGCGRGGTIYHLAGHLWGLEPRGQSFREIQGRLWRVFGERRAA